MIAGARKLVLRARRAPRGRRDRARRWPAPASPSAATRPGTSRSHDERLYQRVLRDGTLGVGETFVDGWWDCDALDQMIDKVVRADLPSTLGKSWVLVAHAVRRSLFNRQAARAFEVGERHYDIGNDLYRAMLGPRMVYTCAYWRRRDNLDAAQEAKLDLVCRKIGAAPGMRVLDLGCGWAGFASFAAEHYGASVVGYTVSREQVAWAKQHYGHLPIDIRLDDYRNATGTYDAVVSIGLMEHVGPKNHRAYMEQAVRCLAPGRRRVHPHHRRHRRAGARSIPGSRSTSSPTRSLPSLGQLATAMEGVARPRGRAQHRPALRPTLMAWWQNFDAAWPSLRDKYGDRFYRMWKYYLLVSAAYFRARAPQPVSGGRDAPRRAATADRALHLGSSSGPGFVAEIGQRRSFPGRAAGFLVSARWVVSGHCRSGACTSSRSSASRSRAGRGAASPWRSRCTTRACSS